MSTPLTEKILKVLLKGQSSEASLSISLGKPFFLVESLHELVASGKITKVELPHLFTVYALTEKTRQQLTDKING